MENNNTQPPRNNNSALVAMSGGVDSAVAAMLAINAGISCEGATMRLHAGGQDGEAEARAIADRLGVPHTVLDFTGHFQEHVINSFIESYLEGRTPNPCIECNRHIKFGVFMEKAHKLSKGFIATGHYARIVKSPNGRYLLEKGADASKDQSYVLYTLTQGQLSHTLFPLGALTKAQVRELARDAGLENAGSAESQDICFIPDGDYASFIERRMQEPLRKGRFIDINGNDLGENKGVAHYTVGQRRGLGLAGPQPVYVLETRAADNTVVVGGNELLYSKSLQINDINLIPVDILDAPIKARVKLRYRQEEQPATIFQTGRDSIRIEFDEPQRAITKGQAAVIYDGSAVIGGGTIV